MRHCGLTKKHLYRQSSVCVCVCVCVFVCVLYACMLCTVILSWFVDKQVISKALQTGTLIEEEDIESKPEKVPHSVLDENVDLCLVRPYFSSDAWLLLEEVVSTKAQTIVWTCTSCHHDLQQESIACDSCLCWYDFRCVGLKGRPKAKYWFCRSCHSKCT